MAFSKKKKKLLRRKEKPFLVKVMCEFNVILDGKTLFKDVVYAKNEKGQVTVKNVFGEKMEFDDCQIIEVDVNATRLILQSTKD